MLLRFYLSADKETAFDKPIGKMLSSEFDILQRQTTGKQACHKLIEIMFYWRGEEDKRKCVHRQLHLELQDSERTLSELFVKHVYERER